MNPSDIQRAVWAANPVAWFELHGRIEGKEVGKQLLAMVRKLKARSVPDFLARVQRWEDKQVNRLKGLRDTEAKRAAIRDQRETLVAVAEGCANVMEIETRIKSLFQDSDESPRPAVVLSSVHKAKGLEWDRVFVLNWTFSKRKPKTPAEKRAWIESHPNMARAQAVQALRAKSTEKLRRKDARVIADRTSEEALSMSDDDFARLCEEAS